MKFIWSTPPKATDSSGKVSGIGFPRIFWEQAVWGWLHFNGVWPDEGYSKLDYNYAYDFYDIKILEDGRPGHGTPTRAIEAMRSFLQRNKHLKAAEMGWTEVIDGLRVDGVRFWIYAEKS